MLPPPLFPPVSIALSVEVKVEDEVAGVAGEAVITVTAVSYTHLTLPTKRIV